MRRVIELIGVIGMIMICGMSVHAEEPHHTRWWEVEDYITEEELNAQIEEEIKEGEMEMLAQLIEAEAGNQDYHGKCLVADVVLNRVASDKFPNTIEEVIYQYTGKTAQFSTISDGAFDKAGWNISEDSFNASYQEYMAERRIDDNILYFTAGGYNPYCIPAYKYGGHYFGY